MLKYKVGDRVVLRNDLKYGISYGDNSWVFGMERAGPVIIRRAEIFYSIEGGWYFYTDEMIDHEATERLKKSTIGTTGSPWMDDRLREQAVKEDVFELYQKAQPERDKSNKKVWDKVQAKKKAAETKFDIGCDFGAGESTGYAAYNGGIRAYKKWIEGEFPKNVFYSGGIQVGKSMMTARYLEEAFTAGLTGEDVPYWHSPKTPFEQARDLFLGNRSQEVSGVYQGLKKGVKTTVVKLENGSKGVVKKYYKDEDCDTTAIYEAYIKALKEDNDDQIKARNIIRRAAEIIEKDTPSDKASIDTVWKVDGCDDYFIRKGNGGFEMYEHRD